MFVPPQTLWYPQDKKTCNRTDAGHGASPSAAALAQEYDCIEGHLRKVAAANTQRTHTKHSAVACDSWVIQALVVSNRES